MMTHNQKKYLIVIALSLGLTGLLAISAARAQEGIGSGWSIAPYIELAATHDSNIDQSAQELEEDDMFYDGLAGILIGRSVYHFDLSLHGYLSTRKYQDFDEKDFDEGGEMLKLRQGLREQLLIQASQSYRVVEDLDRFGAETAVGGVTPDSVLGVASRSRREIQQYALSLGRNMTDKSEVDAGYRYDETIYDDNALRDLISHGGNLELAHQISAKSSAYLEGSYQRQEGNEDNISSDEYAVRAGFKSRGTDKVTYRAGAGISRFEFEGEDAEDAASYDFSLSWALTEKTTLTASARNGTTQTTTPGGQISEFQMYSLSLANRLRTNLSMSISAAYRIDDYLNDPQEDEGLGLRARIDYQLPALSSVLFAEAKYEQVDSNIEEDYDQVRLMLGLRIGR